MSKHRKKPQFRRMVIAAVVVSAVGIPSAAMACTDWGRGSDSPASSAPRAAEKDWWYATERAQAGDDRSPSANGTGSGTPSATPSKTATAVPLRAESGSQDGARGHQAPRKAGSTPTARPHRSEPAPRATASAPAPRATVSAVPTVRSAHATATASPVTPAATAPATTAPAATSAPTATATPSAPQTAATASSTVARIVQLVNAERAKVGCSAVTLNSTLNKVAQAHSADMAAHQNMSHTGSDGSAPGDRLTSAGYAWSTYGENVAYGYATPEEVMAGWMASPGHRANILNCSFKEMGVGLAQPGSYWTQDFGTAR
ncbi:CAP domain-containing protein [Streptomyces sp. NPDC005573]|uniref:CAP domain-containing protein n=1 Tax=Streptomyces sp. NPDC005573 TaxID=3156890 RepID=UPI0033AC6D90